MTSGLDSTLTELTDLLGQELGDGLLAVYLGGSVALGDFMPASSDVDMIAVCARSLDAAERTRLADALVAAVATFPARGLEFVLYTKEHAARFAHATAFELNLNAGPRMRRHITYDVANEPPFWFTLDVAILRERGKVLRGPVPTDIFAAIPRQRVLAALLASLAWHRERNPASPSTVLNACRAWRFAEEGVWSSKSEAGAWACRRAPEWASLIQRARAQREAGDGEPMDTKAVIAWLARTSAAVEAVLESL